MPTKQWFQVEVGNEIRDRNTFSVIFHIQPRFQVAVRVPIMKQILEVSIGPSPRTMHVTFLIREETGQIGENTRLLA